MFADAEIKNRFLERKGGYTKITKLRYRDGAPPVSVIELVGRPEAKTKKKKSKAQEAMDKVKGLMPNQGKKEEEENKRMVLII